MAGFSGFGVGDLIYLVERSVSLEAYPAPSDAAYLGSYFLLAGGAVVMVRARRDRHDVTGLLDALIISAGVAVMAAVFVVIPLAETSDFSLLAKIVYSTYPVADVLLLAILVRLWATAGARTASFRLLLAAFLCTLVADGLWNLTTITTGGATASQWSDLLWLASYVLLAAAAWSSSMGTLTEPAPTRQEAPLTRRRLVMLSGGLLLPAVALLLDGAGGGRVHWQVLGVGAVIMSGLVLTRMAGLLRALQVSNEELTRANGAVADLVAMLSHDLRVPLTVVIGYSEMALESWPTMSQEQQLDVVRKVHTAGTTLNTMLDDTLTVSAIDGDGVQPRRVPVRVDQAVREAMATVPDAALAGQDHRQLLEPVTAVVDRGHLDQVLNNLLTNAVKYGGGRISVSTREVLDMVEVVVSDSGPGVPAEFVARLFDRFTRAEDARSGGRKGTGLGLYITRSLLTANAGTIEYRPTPGGGSSFCVQLPRLRTPSDPVIPPPDAGRAQASTTLKHPV